MMYSDSAVLCRDIEQAKNVGDRGQKQAYNSTNGPVRANQHTIAKHAQLCMGPELQAGMVQHLHSTNSVSCQTSYCNQHQTNTQ